MPWLGQALGNKHTSAVIINTYQMKISAVILLKWKCNELNSFVLASQNFQVSSCINPSADVDLVVHAAGPFQQAAKCTVLEAAIETKVRKGKHYVSEYQRSG